MKSIPAHWDAIFAKTATMELGWYEQDSRLSIQFLNQIKSWQTATIFVAGAGTTNLIEELLTKNTNLVVNDISAEAINIMKSRVGGKAKNITWLCQDISAPLPSFLQPIDIWFDRAVLHFLVDDEDIVSYFNNIKSSVKISGHVILAEFSKTGALKCAGLNVHRYSLEELANNLGSDFQLLNHFETNFINPRGDPRPYIYGLFKRIK